MIKIFKNGFKFNNNKLFLRFRFFTKTTLMQNKSSMLLLCWLLLLLPAIAFAQQKNISGKITDQNASPVAGANIAVKGSTGGTMSDAQGNFSLKVSVGATIEISFTGFRTQTLKITNETNSFNIALKEDYARLDEVVVTGLATTVKRSNAANAVAVIGARELAGTAPAQTFDAALNGKVVGANIIANSGAPGGGTSIKLRGVTTIFGNSQPLFVVDGVIVNNSATSAGLNAVTAAATAGNSSNQDNASNRIADLNPEDIQTVEVLKGASAASIYGAQAAAGVVIITTKRGRAGKTRFNLSQDVGFNSIIKYLGQRPLTDKIVQDQGWDVAAYDAAKAAGKLYDYEKEMYGQKGFIRDSRLSISGGNDKTTFYMAGGLRNEDGIIKGTGYANNSLRVNIDHHISDKIKLSYSSTYINSSANRGLTNNDNAGVSFGVALSSTPSFAQLFPDANGIYPNNPFAASNPLQTRDLMTNNELTNRYIGGVNVEAILQESAKMTTKLIARGGLDYYNLKTTALFPSSLQFEVNTTKGHSIQGNTNNVNTNWAGFLVNSYKPSDKLSFVTTAGITHEFGKYDNILNVATQLIGIQTNLDQAGAINVSQFRIKYKNDGAFVQEEFALNNYLNITAGVRFDQSTNNGDYKKYFTYPKANVAWNLSKMNFWKSNTINDLKLRVAYGESSNFPAYISRFTPLNSANIGGYAGSLVTTVLGDGNIGSERQTELEAGVDVSVLEGKLSLEATFYNKVVKDLLLQGQVPASTGFSTRYLNAGSLRNRGVELSLKAIPVDNKNFRWSSTTNFWMNRSLITQLNIPAFPLGAFGTTLGTYFIQQGATATQIVGLNGNGGVGKLGDAEPYFQMNFLNDFTIHKNWSLRFLIHWKQGGDVINLTQLLTDLGGTSPDFDVLQSNGKTAGANRIAALGVSSRPFVQNASFVKFREIGLYYTLPYKIKNIDRIQLGVSGNNLIVITPYVGYDPEVSNFGVGFSSGVDVTPFPTSKRVQFHVSIAF